MTELFPYQQVGARFLADRKRALLADDMGLGKSAQAIAAAREVGANRVVVVCPASVKQNWLREIEKFWPECPGTVVVSYDFVARNFKPDGPGWYEPGVNVLILDEAHYLKTRTAKRTTAIFGPKCDGVGGLVERAKHVFCLTGTPTPNNPSELWPMLRAVMPDAIQPMAQYDVTRHTDHGVFHDGVSPPVPIGKPLSYWGFVSKYCVTRDNGFGTEIVKGKNLTELKARIAPFILRRKKEEVLKDLPPIRFDTLPLEGRMPDETRDFEYDHIALTLKEEGVAGLAKIAPHVATLRRMTGLAKVAPAVEWIRDWLDACDNKLVVFAHHRDVLKGLWEGLLPFGSVLVQGDTASEVRQTQIDEFQRDPTCRVFIGQIQAAGVGITLTAASDVLFVESSWVPAENEQAAMRVHRIGQKNACLVRFAMLAGSIDEDIQKAVLRKTADISRLWG